MTAFPDIGVTAFVLTLVIGGAGSWLAGRAIARGWRPWWIAVLWMIPLAAAVRFLQTALFAGRLAALPEAAVVLAALAVVAAAGHRRTRAQQMTGRYGWLCHPAGILGWRQVGPDGR